MKKSRYLMAFSLVCCTLNKVVYAILLLDGTTVQCVTFNEPWFNVDDPSGLSFYPVGYRDYTGFYGLNTGLGFMWTSTEHASISTNAEYHRVRKDIPEWGFHSSGEEKATGMVVRFVRDIL